MNVIDTKLEHDPNFIHNIYYENWASKQVITVVNISGFLIKGLETATIIYDELNIEKSRQSTYII